MKQEYVLNKLYYNVFNVKYNHNDMKHRNNMQLIVYKLQEAGFDVGGYNFKIDKDKIYSRSLMEDCYSCKYCDNLENIKLTECGHKAIKYIKELLNL